ncbi:MAG: hypothetical protein ACT4OS_07325 [Acidimicrobiales bacterium]
MFSRLPDDIGANLTMDAAMTRRTGWVALAIVSMVVLVVGSLATAVWSVMRADWWAALGAVAGTAAGLWVSKGAWIRSRLP